MEIDFRQPAGRPVAAGGEIGWHPAPVDQLVVVVAGRAWVQGGDGVPAELKAGQAAVWRDDQAVVVQVV